MALGKEAELEGIYTLLNIKEDPKKEKVGNNYLQYLIKSLDCAKGIEKYKVFSSFTKENDVEKD